MQGERRNYRGIGAGRNAAWQLAFACALLMLWTLAFSAPASAHHKIHPAWFPQQLSPFYGIPAGTPQPEALLTAPPQSCRSGPQPYGFQTGTYVLWNYLHHHFPRGENWGGYVCRNVKGTNKLSLHAEGRALDFHLENYDPADKAQGDGILYFFLRPDAAGIPAAMARRFGIQEIIWNCVIWTSDGGGRYYPPCRDPETNRTDRHQDHVHIAQHWYGAVAATTAYSGFSYRHPPF